MKVSDFNRCHEYEGICASNIGVSGTHHIEND